MAKGYTAFVLSDAQRAKLLGIFPTAFDNVVAHHITHEFGVDALQEDYDVEEFRVIGITCDDGVQALVVEHHLECGLIDRYRPDNKRYHITWSLAPGRKPVDSNRVILEYGFYPFDGLAKFEAEYTFIPF